MPTKADVWINIHRIATLVMPIILAVSGYFLTDVYSKMSAMDKQIRELELNQATTSGNRFTSNDWSKARTNLDNERNLLDKRVTRLEESVPMIKETLFRVENKIDKLQEDIHKR